MNAITPSATPDSSKSRTARIAASLADHTTPLIQNAWYVLGFGKEFTRELTARTVLGYELVFYRATDGQPVALRNRCPHRSMPLSKGCLEEDKVRCGYHGLLFDRNGICLEIPSQSAPPPATAKISAYQCVESGPLVWVWMGAPEAADASTIPATDWLTDPAWAYASGYVCTPSNYVGLHENLLDLSHFTFLHPGNVGTPEYSAAPFECTVNGDDVRISRHIANCGVPSLYTKPTGMTTEDRVARATVSRYISPGMNTAYASLINLAPKPGAQEKFEQHISHFITPATIGSTHYFFTFARNFAVQSEEVTSYVQKAATEAFAQDVDALVAIKEIGETEAGLPFEEINLRSDQAGVAMRRILKRLSDQERSASI
jgi:phenylpropionate dioxygenase-like ring-hydroxylating dioxygenase large terminal subunit